MPVTCAHLSVSSLPQHFVCLPLSVENELLDLSTSQYFVHLPLSIQRLQARSKYIHVCSSAPSSAHKACTRYTERPNLRFWLPALRSTLFICHFRYNACRHAASKSMRARERHPWRTRPVRVIQNGRTCASGSQYFAALCLSATFDTTLAGTQQVHPCMLRCAILGAQGLYALYRKAELALLALSTSQYFVYLPLSIQRLQARSKYIHVCSGAPSLAHKACTRYTERPNLRFWLPAPSSQPSIFQTIIHPRLNPGT